MISRRLQVAYLRLTLTPLHVLFLIFAVFHVAVLIIVQSVAFTANDAAREAMLAIMNSANVSSNSLAIVGGSSNNPMLFDCNRLPRAVDFGNLPNLCNTVWSAASGPSSRRRALFPDNVSAEPAFDAGELVGVTVNGLSGAPIILSLGCVETLVYPEQMLVAAGRENISLLFYDVWIFVVSILALLQQSAAHLVLSVATLALAAAYSVFNAYHTVVARHDFEQIVTNGACGGVELLPGYFGVRAVFDGTNAGVNWASLLATAILAWKLAKRFRESTFETVGAPPAVARARTWALALSIVLRLYFFFAVLSTALWLAQVATQLGHGLVPGSTLVLFATGGGVSILAVLPWVVLGERATTHENGRFLACFFGLGGALLVYKVAMFGAGSAYQWSLRLWPFFAITTAAAALLQLAALCVGVMCWRTFGAGLAHFLQAQAALNADGFTGAEMPKDPDSASFSFLDDIRGAGGRFRKFS